MYKLLVAEDEYKIRTGLCTYFPWERIGFEVVGQAENGKQALDFLLNNDVDVLLCDIKMPIMTGIELAEELHKQNSKVKIIFLSGHRNFEFAQKAMSLGVKNYIVKSTKYNELVSVFEGIKDELDQAYSNKIEEAQESSDDTAEVLNYYKKLISTIKTYVNQHYYNVSLEDVSKLVNMSPNYLSRLFKQKTGVYFSDYLLSVRMEKAIYLLKDIKIKIYEVSSQLGYSNVKNFTRAFKNFYGKGPREYRNNESLDN